MRPTFASDDVVSRLVAELYDHVPHRRDRRCDIDFYVDMVAGCHDRCVLELGCGTGRILVPMAKVATRVVGIDVSPDMLRLCAQRLQAEEHTLSAEVTLVEADMRTFDLGETFALVGIPFRGFQHLRTIADQTACLSRIRQHLEPGGVLVLDVNPFGSIVTLKIGAERRDPKPFTLPDGRRVRLAERIVSRDRCDQIVDAEMIYEISDGSRARQRIVQPVSLRYFTRFELHHLLTSLGFDVKHVYGNYLKAPFTPETSSDLVIVAAKSAP